MGRIQSSIGLITGVPIKDTVDQLMAISSRPRDMVARRNQGLKAEQLAIGQLTSSVVALQLTTKGLAEADVFHTKTATSQDTSLLAVTIPEDAAPVAGKYQFTPVQQASANQMISSTFTSRTEPIGTGSLSMRLGGFVDEGVNLSELNSGNGIHRGKIRITDRSGSSAVIDLRFARTVDDVLDAISSNETIQVKATAVGDSFRLTDSTGQTAHNLTVDEVHGGTTAASLGIASIDAAANQATGSDVFQLHNEIALSHLNDNRGVALNNALSDIEVTFRDGSAPLQIDFHIAPVTAVKAAATTTATNGETAQIVFTAVDAGTAMNDVNIVFADTATAGSETYSYDEGTKTLTVGIESGVSLAGQVTAALTAPGNEAAAALFTAAVVNGGGGQVTDSDTGLTAGGVDAATATNEQTLGDLIDTINAADPARLSAKISADGDHIELTDLTSGGGTFAVSSLFGGSVAEDLGLTATASSGVITGNQIQSGLKTSLLAGTFGQLDLTDRSGATASVDLSSIATIDDVTEAINAAAVGITASVNSDRSGIILTDTTGSTSSHLIVANGDATNTADALHLTVDADVDKINSGSLDIPIIGRGTALATLNGGEGVTLGTMVLTDTNGAAAVVELDDADAHITTVGGVIDAINALSIGITAEINATGDGIRLIDTAGGDESMTVRDSGSDTAAADLHIAGTSTEVDIAGTPTQVIDGATTLHIDIEADDSLDDLIKKINDLNLGVSAGAFGAGSEYRLTLTSQATGKANAIYLDSSNAGFTFQETAKAKDAVVLYGSPDHADVGILATSTTNTFTNLIEGLEISIEGASEEGVTIDVSTTDSSVVKRVQQFVDAYNKIHENLQKFTEFDETNQTTAILFGSAETLRVETDLSRLASGRFLGVGSFKSLQSLGVSLDDKGKMHLDTVKLQAAFAKDPKSVETFFTDEKSGFAAKFDGIIESLAGDEHSLLSNRNQSLSDIIEDNVARIEQLDAKIERQRERLLREFYNMELAIAKIKANLSTVEDIKPIPIYTGDSG